MDASTSILGDVVDCFYDDTRKNIYKSMLALYNENRDIGQMLVFEKLKSMGYYNSVISEEYSRIISYKALTDMTEACTIILDYYNKRRLGELMSAASQEAAVDNNTYHTVIDRLSSGIDAIIGNTVAREITATPDIVVRTLDYIDELEYAARNNIELGILPAFKSLKEKIGWLEGNQLITIAGRPGEGKTALAVSMMIEIARRKPVLFFSLEMDEKQLMTRVLSRESGVGLEKMRKGTMSDIDKVYLEDASLRVSALKMHIDDSSDLDLMTLRNKLRKHKKEHGIQVVMIDYLQLITPPNEKSREQEVAKMTRTMKKLSKQFDIPIIILAQLNRGVENRGEGATPMLSDLRESGSIEQDSDIVMFVHKSAIHVAKQRQGSLGVVPLGYDKSLTSFYELPEESTSTSTS